MGVYTPDRAGIGAMLNAPWMVAMVEARGDRVLDECEATAPVYSGPSGDPHRGRYKDSFRKEAVSYGGRNGDRACCYVWNDSPEALVVEFGLGPSEHKPKGQEAHRTMRNALRAAGD